MNLQQELEEYADLMREREEILEEAKEEKDWDKVYEVQADLLGMADTITNLEVQEA